MDRYKCEESKDIRECSCCRKEVERADMCYTRDCHGVIFRLVCSSCYSSLMAKGYDGCHYDEEDCDEVDGGLATYGRDF